ncbi:MAG: AtpZ/AtpI family protein [Rhodospirillaceae bacterium]
MGDRPKSFGALDRAVLRRTAQQEQAKRDASRSIIRNLNMMGALGWMSVIPPLATGFLGRWLDRMFDTGYKLTAVLVLIGIGLGCWLVYQRLLEEGVLARGNGPRTGKRGAKP